MSFIWIWIWICMHKHKLIVKMVKWVENGPEVFYEDLKWTERSTHLTQSEWVSVLFCVYLHLFRIRIKWCAYMLAICHLLHLWDTHEIPEDFDLVLRCVRWNHKTKDVFLLLQHYCYATANGLMATHKMLLMWSKIHGLTDDWHMNHRHFNHNRPWKRKQDQRCPNNFLRFQKGSSEIQHTSLQKNCL